ncbi:MAG: hypothetical protein GXO93_07065 [FCB group bacterium]|nr:hypothetical protein [FCB group bacterium]
MHLLKNYIFIVGLIWLLWAACDNPTVTERTLEGELQRYIINDEVPQDLFRLDSLITDSVYKLPFSDTLYRDYLDSTARALSFDFGDNLYLPFGVYKYAEVTFFDTLFGHTQKIVGSQVSEANFVRPLVRQGLFVKLGRDQDSYSGWLLFGYNGGNPVVDMKVRVSTGATFSGTIVDTLKYPVGDVNNMRTFPYLRLEEIFKLENGSNILISSTRLNTYNPLVYGQVVTYESSNSLVTKNLIQSDTNIYYFSDTVTLQNNKRLWNIINVQAFIDDNGNIRFIRAWCLPYKGNL